MIHNLFVLYLMYPRDILLFGIQFEKAFWDVTNVYLDHEEYGDPLVVGVVQVFVLSKDLREQEP